MKFSLVASLVALLGCMTACEKTIYTRGCAMDFSDFKKIIIGRDDAQAVIEKVGSPAISSSIEDERGGYDWFYVSKRVEKNGFLDAKVLDQKMVIVSFNSHDVVTSIKESTEERHVEFVKEQTETSGKGTGVTSEIFGGLGKYRKRYEKN